MSFEAIVPEWPAPARVRAVVTTRRGGESREPYASFNLGLHVGDQVEAVERNRGLLRAHLPAPPLWMNQQHGTRVIEAESSDAGSAADGAVAHAPGKVLVVLSADCLPVLLCDRNGTAVGVAHAGWRGLSAGIIENVIAALRCEPKDLLAWLGPAISGAVYEVGAEVRAAFVDAHRDAASAFTPHANGRYLADLYAIARQRLAKAGIMAVFGGTHCTYLERERFYSYRRDGTTGRFASLIWLARH